jgi:CubicO group peptidase (beta-lactamase class C family)
VKETPNKIPISVTSLSQPISDFISKNILSNKTNTSSFLIIKDDSIVYHYDKLGQTKPQMCFSISKTIVATMIGIAIKQGKIKSTNDKIISYLPELDTSGYMHTVTIEHLLDMTANLSFNEAIIGLNAPLVKLYYGKNLNKLIKEVHKTDPSFKFIYQNVCTQILVAIIENATKTKFQDYTKVELLNKLGFESTYSWIIDNKTNKTVKGFFGFSCDIKDLAKFGQLYLNQGVYKGDTILSQSWIKSSVDLDTLYKNPYNNSWWANNLSQTFKFNSEEQFKNYIISNNIAGNITNENNGIYTLTAKGNVYNAYGYLDQFMFIHPEKRLIVIRLGDEPKNGVDLDKIILRLINAI